MTNAEELATVACQIIAEVGTARSCYIEAIHAAESGDYDQVGALLDEGREAFNRGHCAHTELVQREAAGDPVSMTLIMTHAEDQLMSAEQFGILAEEFVSLYRRVDGKA